jgi:hypothetical protein
MPITSCNRRVKSLHSGGFKLLPSQEWFQTLTAPTISSGSGPSAIGPWYYLDDTLHLSTQISQDCKTLHIPSPNKPKLRPPLQQTPYFPNPNRPKLRPLLKTLHLSTQISQNCETLHIPSPKKPKLRPLLKALHLSTQISQHCIHHYKYHTFLIQIGQNCVHSWKHCTREHR